MRPFRRMFRPYNACRLGLRTLKPGYVSSVSQSPRRRAATDVRLIRVFKPAKEGAALRRRTSASLQPQAARR